MIMDYPDSIDCLGLILNSDLVEPAAWHMAIGTLLDFANDGKICPIIVWNLFINKVTTEKYKSAILEREYFAPRSLELLRRETDPLLTGTLLRFLTTLTRLCKDLVYYS